MAVVPVVIQMELVLRGEVVLGGGGRGGGYIANTNRNGERGTDGTGGGGGGGYAPGGPTGVYPTPGPGTWTGQNGGSGVMMIRYVHPGS